VANASGSGSRARLPSTRKLILLDEPVSALDVSIQAQVINLLEELQGEFQLSYIFVAHDLTWCATVSDRIIVMYLGKLMEVSPARELYEKPIHPLHDGAARVRSRSRTRRRIASATDRSRRRAAQPGKPAERLSLSPALPSREPRSAARSSRR